MSYHETARLAAEHRLEIYGGFHPDDGGTLLLLGPGAGVWEHVSAAPEFEHAKDPLDRWSRRVIGGMAEALGAEALFPFDGPPWHPFQSWAQATGRCWESPVRLLVHDRAGLWASFRGALRFSERLALPEATAPRPCEACDAPCLTACPVGALGPDGYDTAACHAYLNTPPGADCLSRGCKVRRACPVSAAFPRVEAQSAFHMSHFHKPGTN
ncbi:ferredoxin [Oceanicola sp. D3]|uniref:ferredoxin n=1 Tax=Oceanicola sp. D3 TaxID=2587163 RepID=UPI00143D1860|nr:ferredoxin [Oceanicola sp. D3]